jgi:hypothetical protein
LAQRDIGISRARLSNIRRAARGIAFLAAMLVLAGSALAADHGEKKPAKGESAIEGPAFIKLAPIVLPIFGKDNKVARQAGLVLALELEPGKTAGDLEPDERKLRDAFITDLYTLFEQTADAEHVIDVALIKQRLQDTSERVLGPGVVHAVLIQQAFERAKR